MLEKAALVLLCNNNERYEAIYGGGSRGDEQEWKASHKTNDDRKHPPRCKSNTTEQAREPIGM